RALHERIKTSGLSYEQPRFTFTPHLTLSFYPELNRQRLAELLAFRIDEPLPIAAIQVYRASDLTRTERVLDLPLTGPLGCRWPPGFAAGAGRGLDGSGDGGAQPVGGGVRAVAGGHGARAPRGPVDVRARRLRPRLRWHTDHGWHRGHVHRVAGGARPHGARR